MKKQDLTLEKSIRFIKPLIVSLLFLSLNVSCEKKDSSPKGVSDIIDGPPVVTAKKIKDNITSNLIDDKPTFKTTVYLPAAYESNKNLPVIYLLNDRTGKIIVGNISASQILDKTIAAAKSINFDAIIVLLDTDEHPIKYKDPTSLYVQSFYDFITKELIPFVDKNYENDNSQKTFLGHGDGARFAIIALLQEDLENPYFNNFISVDPYLMANIPTKINRGDFPQSKPNLKLYLSMSNTADYDDQKTFSNLIQAKQYPWLDILYTEKLEYDHNAIIDPSLIEGLKFVYNL